MKKILSVLLIAIVCNISGARSSSDIRLLYWNIQNGMWSDQGNNYDNFVKWVQDQEPDICVWCEAVSIYHTGTADKLATEDEKYLPYNWDELAARYGHQFVYLGGWHDNYPQVITSKYPISNVKRILGSKEDVIVSHGAAWAAIEIKGHKINLVTLHTWPQAFTYKAENREKSAAESGGDYYREKEIRYICENTVLTVPSAKDEMWLMMGDFNSRSRVDAAQYDYPADSPKYLVHDYIRKETPMIDILAKYYDGKFFPSTLGGHRIDFVYSTQAMYNRIHNIDILQKQWIEPCRDNSGKTKFCHPSDHMPIIVDFTIDGIATEGETVDPDWKEAENGGQYAVVHKEIFGAMQNISIYRYKASEKTIELANDSGLNPAKKPGYPSAVDPQRPATSTSSMAERYGALAAINGSYFNMKTLYPTTYTKDNGDVEGYTTPDELFRVDGAVAFKKHKVKIAYSDTLSYEKVFKGYDEVMAAGPVLISNGKLAEGWPETNFFICRHPRTLIGTTRDGWVYLIVIDGRFHGQGEGATISETAEIARLLGLNDAINLDGGGSCAIWVKGAGTLNHPFDNHTWDNNGERTVPNIVYVK